MKIFFDTEFIEAADDTLSLISIGMVRSDGAEYYAEVVNREIPWEKADPWVLANVRPLLDGSNVRTKAQIAEAILEFAGNRPEFWAYFCSYDWVVLARLYGTLVDIPSHFPRWCRDLKSLMAETGTQKVDLPKQVGSAHNALEDARWNKAAWEFMNKKKRKRIAEAEAEVDRLRGEVRRLSREALLGRLA